MPERRFLQKRSATYKRRANRFEPRQRFLIVYEGEKTEPQYFKKFPIPRDSVVYDCSSVGRTAQPLILGLTLVFMHTPVDLQIPGIPCSSSLSFRSKMLRVDPS